MTSKYIFPDWPAPAGIGSASTTRLDGVGARPYDSFNLGIHVGDDPAIVQRNRALLIDELQLPAPPQWLNQIHEADVQYVAFGSTEVSSADAAWTDKPGCVLTVMTADCLPLLLASKTGGCIAAIHGGWRSLHAGIIQNTIMQMPAAANDLMAWMGPAIGPDAFEVGEEVREAFAAKNADFNQCFRARETQGKFLANLYAIAKMCLLEMGVTACFGGNRCTFQDQTHFFSHRRDGSATGRMASLIWIK